MFEKITSWWAPTPTPAAAVCPYDPTNPKMNPLNPEGLKPCCACPQTKSARDDCFLKYDTAVAEVKCSDLVQQHMACMRGLGFKI